MKKYYVICSFFILLLSWYTLYHARSYAYDDAYIIYHYSQNVADGNGLVFNRGEKSLGVTVPLYALLLGGLHALLPMISISRLGVILAVLSLSLIAFVWMSWFRDEIEPVTLIAALIILFFHPAVDRAFGSAFLPASALFVAGLWQLSRRRPYPGVFLVSLSVLIRPEFALVALPAVVLYALKERRLPLKPIIGAGAMGLIYCLTLLLMAGRIIPRTLGAKYAQAAVAPDHGIFFFRRFFQHMWINFFSNSHQVIFFLMIIGTILLVVRWKISFKSLYILSPLPFLLFYVLGHFPYYFWYVTPFHIVSALAIPFAIQIIVGKTISRRQWVLALLIVLTLYSMGVDLQRRHQDFRRKAHHFGRRDIYKTTAQWLNEHIPSAWRVAHVEVGTLGYYCRSPILDLMGLVSPQVTSRDIRKRGAGEVIMREKPEVVIIWPLLFPYARVVWENPGFCPRYRIVQIIRDPGVREPVIICARSDLPLPKGCSIVSDLSHELLIRPGVDRHKAHLALHDKRWDLGLVETPRNAWGFHIKDTAGKVFESWVRAIPRQKASSAITVSVTLGERTLWKAVLRPGCPLWHHIVLHLDGPLAPASGTLRLVTAPAGEASTATIVWIRPVIRRGSSRI